jgi:hypothetical protein
VNTVLDLKVDKMGENLEQLNSLPRRMLIVLVD